MIKKQKPMIIRVDILKVRNELHFDAQLRFPARIAKSKKVYNRKKEKINTRRILNES